jgi:hypothetical protein
MGTVPRKFRRHDGVVGYGFYIEWAGLRQASVSWPDIPAMRYTEFNMARGDVEDLGEVDPQEITPEIALNALSSAFAREPDYAHTWQANIACCALDEGVSADIANKIADRFMKLAFGVCTPEVIPEVSTQQDTQQDTQQVQSVADSVATENPPQTFKNIAGSSLSRDDSRTTYAYFVKNPEASIPQAIEHLATINVDVTTEQAVFIRDEVRDDLKDSAEAIDETEATEPEKLPADPLTANLPTDQPS